MSHASFSLRTQGTREEGQALVEYGLILALVAIVAIVAVSLMGASAGGMYDVVEGVATAMADALAG